MNAGRFLLTALVLTIAAASERVEYDEEFGKSSESALQELAGFDEEQQTASREQELFLHMPAIHVKDTTIEPTRALGPEMEGFSMEGTAPALQQLAPLEVGGPPLPAQPGPAKAKRHCYQQVDGVTKRVPCVVKASRAPRNEDVALCEHATGGGDDC